MPRPVAVVGGGPAGLMAAEVLVAGGVSVDLFDAMPSVGRKFLLAGKGGLNLTHAEDSQRFRARYGGRAAQLAAVLEQFGAEQVREWARGLGVDTFVGSSGRVFPADMKAAPLLRAWLHRMRVSGVRFHTRYRWCGWNQDGTLGFDTPDGQKRSSADAVVLALGGGSWPRLGSNGAWTHLLAERNVPLVPLRPANCGFDVAWSEHFRQRHAGHPLKSVVATHVAMDGTVVQRPGELIVTNTGLEGSLIYALSANLRDAIEAQGSTVLHIDLAPGKSVERLVDEISHPRGSRSMSSHLQSRAGIGGVKAGLLRECTAHQDYADPQRLAARIKSLPLRLIAPRPLAEAISSAGGVRFEGLDERLMVRALPGVFCAGEMLDWEAPTGGYLLTACLATGRAAGLGTLEWLKTRSI